MTSNTTADKLAAALRGSIELVDDLLNVYVADEMCDPARVAEARKRLSEDGTLFQIAIVQQANKVALAAYDAKQTKAGTVDRTLVDTLSGRVIISRECAEFFLNMGDGACDIRDYLRYGEELRAALSAGTNVRARRYCGVPTILEATHMADNPAKKTTYRVKRQFTGSDGQSYAMGREYTSNDQKEVDKQLAAGNIEEVTE